MDAYCIHHIHVGNPRKGMKSSMTTKVAKNDPCPCGSEKPYKDCCGREAAMEAAQTRNKLIAVGVIVIAGIGTFLYMNRKDQENVVEIPADAVYDEEHRHWHNAEGTELYILGWYWNMAQQKFFVSKERFHPQPSGEVPEGKTWSPEHGHWHNIADGSDHEESALIPQPPGEAPEGKVWSLEHGHWHNVE